MFAEVKTFAAGVAPFSGVNVLLLSLIPFTDQAQNMRSLLFLLLFCGLVCKGYDNVHGYFIHQQRPTNITVKSCAVML